MQNVTKNKAKDPAGQVKLFALPENKAVQSFKGWATNFVVSYQ